MQKEKIDKINSHAELDSASRCYNREIPNQVWNDYFLKEEALNKNTFRASLRSGFTLVELLVVVLIIGILAAVALPQYNKAVLKARVTEIQSFYNAAEKALELYVLENGYQTPTKDLSNGLANELSIDLSNFGNISDFTLTSSSGKWFAQLAVTNSELAIYIFTYDSMGGQVIISSWLKKCGYTSTADKGKEICEAFVAGRSGWTIELGS